MTNEESKINDGLNSAEKVRSVGQLVSWLAGQLVAQLVCHLVAWLLGYLVTCLLVCFVHWSLGHLVTWLVSWLDGQFFSWSVGQFDSFCSHSQCR